MEGKFNRILERILVFSTSTSLMLTATGIFSRAINNYEVERILIDWFTYSVITFSGFIFTLVLQLFALEKIKSAMHIVFIFFYIIAVLILCALSGKTDAPYVLIITLALQYFIEAGINEMFILHDRFLYECEEYKGKELEAFLFRNNLSAVNLTEKIRGQQAVFFGLSVAMFIILVFGKLSDGLFTPIITILIIVFFLSILLCCFLTGLFENDVFYAFLGLKNYITDKKRIFRSVFMIFLLAAGAGFLISSDNPFIKIQYVEKYREMKDLKHKQNYDSSLFEKTPVEKLLEEITIDEEKPSWIIELIFEVLKYAVIVFTGAAFILFFFKPFFTNHWRVFWQEGRLVKFLQKFWEDFKQFFNFIFSKQTDLSAAYSTVESRKFRDTITDFIKKHKRTKEKEEEIDRLTKYFMRLIDWGESQGIKYRTNLAPAEYTKLIEDKTDDYDLKKCARNSGFLFEKALYDKNILTDTEEKDFINSIEAILCIKKQLQMSGLK